MTWLHWSEQPNPTDFNGLGKNLIQLQLQFPHQNLAMTSGWLSPCTKSCNSSWQGAFKALLLLCFPFYRATQCLAVPPCQSIQSTGHHLESLPIPGALFSSHRTTTARKAQLSFTLWNETESFWQNINKCFPPPPKNRQPKSSWYNWLESKHIRLYNQLQSCYRLWERLVIREQCI